MHTIFADQEFKPLEKFIKGEYQATLNCTNINKYVPEAENNNKVIKEQACAGYHTLLFQALPYIMIKILVMELAWKLNYFPLQGRVSKYYSPCMIIYKKH